MAKRRRFTPEFKAEVVLEALRGENSQAELCRRHDLSQDQLSKWKQQAVEHFSSLFTSADQQSSEATERIAELEQFVGRLEVHLNDYQDITEARQSIGHFITQVYNLKRLHSALGDLTPIEFQQQKLA